MSNYVALQRPTTDEHTRALDAMCLAECVWWGAGEDLYRGWNHGIYEWRDLCYRLAKWTHHAWEDVREKTDEASWEFDTEFCPALVEYVLSSQLSIDPYADEWQVVAEFCRDIVNEHIKHEEEAKLLEQLYEDVEFAEAKVKELYNRIECVKNGGEA